MCQKRGRQEPHASLENIALVSESRGAQLIALDDALRQLAAIEPRKSEVVELRFFAGLSLEETAELLKVSRLTVIRDWNFARAWLLSEMRGESIHGK
jgi:RNA polymerase sigma factor (TIGR02999 family)